MIEIEANFSLYVKTRVIDIAGPASGSILRTTFFLHQRKLRNTKLSKNILNLMGLYAESDAIHDLYLQLTQQSSTLNLSDIVHREKQLTQFATEIYSELLKQQPGS